MAKFIFSKKSWLVGLLILLSSIGGYYLARKMDWSTIGDISSSLLGTLLVVALLYMLVNTLSTWMVLRGMGYATHFGRLYLVVTSSLSTNYITPVKAGIPVRLWLYKSMMGIPISSGSASMVIEIALGLLIGVTLSLLGAQFVLRQYDIQPYLVLLSILAAFGAVLLFLRPQLVESFARKLLPSRYASRITNWGMQSLKSIKTVPVWTLAGMVVLYFVRLGMRAFCLHAVLQDMGASSSILDLVSIQSISGIVGIMSMLPMGIGAKDASLTALMIQIGVPHEVALVAVLIDRSLWTLVPLLAGIISANILGVNKLLSQEAADMKADREHEIAKAQSQRSTVPNKKQSREDGQSIDSVEAAGGVLTVNWHQRVFNRWEPEELSKGCMRESSGSVNSMAHGWCR